MRTAASQQQLYPRRGALLHYTPQGCATPPPIAEGQVVQLNDSHASLTCNPGHILQSTLSPVATLRCIGTTHAWTPQVEHCVGVQFLIQYGNKSVVRVLSYQYQKQEQPQTLSESSWQFEAVVTTLIGFLLVFSAIMAIIVLFRGRRLQEYEKEETVHLKKERQAMFVEEDGQGQDRY